MTAYVLELVPRMRKSHRAPAIVMTAVIALALVPAIAVLGPATSGALPSSPQELVTVPEPSADGNLPPQTLGYVEFDWAEGGVPGFGLLPGNSN